MNRCSNIIKRNFLLPLLTADPTPVVALLSLLALWWGILLSINFFLPGVSNSDILVTIHNLYSRHFPRMFWPVLFFFIGIGLMIARYKDSKKWERALILVSSGVWSFSTALLFKEYPLSLVAGTYFIITLLSVWSYWKTNYE